MIDFIGDIHGHADKLEALLKKLGYTFNAGSYSHPERKILFVGDYIDRGPKIRETLDIVRRMVENENAIALMGNHEYNAICFHYPEKEGGHLRNHEIKNILQHIKTLEQFQNKQEEYNEYIDWFKTLPLYYETGNVRAVHACWDYKTISYLQSVLSDTKLTDDLIYESAIKGTKINEAIEITLKGKEITMPEGLDFTDKDGAIRKEIRIKWWEDLSICTYKEISVEPLKNLPDVSVDKSQITNLDFYSDSDKPVFFGHYWLRGNPTLYRGNICCLDYSVAKEGYLVAYRFDEERKLDSRKLVYV
ncbi:MAG: metallophosphoesterase [Saprospiraceae bacterium]